MAPHALTQDDVDLACRIAHSCYPNVPQTAPMYLELDSAAHMGLTNAYNRFDESYGIPFQQFIGVCVRSAVVDMIRSEFGRGKASLETVALDSYEMIPDDAPDPEQCALSQELDNLLQRALDEMPDRRAAKMVELRLQGMKYKDIASLYDVTTWTVSRIIKQTAREIAEFVEDMIE